MGASWRGSAVLGCEVTGKTEREVATRVCAHDITAGAKFCAECGKPATELEKVPIDGWDTIEQAGLSNYTTTDDDRQFVGVGVSVWDDGDAQRLSLDTVELSAVRDKVRSVLTPIGLWDEKSFGLWAVLYCSY